jgi:hypothetical protein
LRLLAHSHTVLFRADFNLPDHAETIKRTLRWAVLLRNRNRSGLGYLDFQHMKRLVAAGLACLPGDEAGSQKNSTGLARDIAL